MLRTCLLRHDRLLAAELDGSAPHAVEIAGLLGGSRTGYVLVDDHVAPAQVRPLIEAAGGGTTKQSWVVLGEQTASATPTLGILRALCPHNVATAVDDAHELLRIFTSAASGAGLGVQQWHFELDAAGGVAGVSVELPIGTLGGPAALSSAATALFAPLSSAESGRERQRLREEQAEGREVLHKLARRVGMAPVEEDQLFNVLNAAVRLGELRFYPAAGLGGSGGGGRPAPTYANDEAKKSGRAAATLLGVEESALRAALGVGCLDALGAQCAAHALATELERRLLRWLVEHLNLFLTRVSRRGAAADTAGGVRGGTEARRGGEGSRQAPAASPPVARHLWLLDASAACAVATAADREVGQPSGGQASAGRANGGQSATTSHGADEYASAEWACEPGLILHRALHTRLLRALHASAGPPSADATAEADREFDDAVGHLTSLAPSSMDPSGSSGCSGGHAAAAWLHGPGGEQLMALLRTCSSHRFVSSLCEVREPRPSRSHTDVSTAAPAATLTAPATALAPAAAPPPSASGTASERLQAPFDAAATHAAAFAQRRRTLALRSTTATDDAATRADRMTAARAKAAAPTVGGSRAPPTATAPSPASEPTRPQEATRRDEPAVAASHRRTPWLDPADSTSARVDHARSLVQRLTAQHSPAARSSDVARGSPPAACVFLLGVPPSTDHRAPHASGRRGRSDADGPSTVRDGRTVPRAGHAQVAPLYEGVCERLRAGHPYEFPPAAWLASFGHLLGPAAGGQGGGGGGGGGSVAAGGGGGAGASVLAGLWSALGVDKRDVAIAHAPSTSADPPPPTVWLSVRAMAAAVRVLRRHGEAAATLQRHVRPGLLHSLSAVRQRKAAAAVALQTAVRAAAARRQACAIRRQRLKATATAAAARFARLEALRAAAAARAVQAAGRRRLKARERAARTAQAGARVRLSRLECARRRGAIAERARQARAAEALQRVQRGWITRRATHPLLEDVRAATRRRRAAARLCAAARAHPVRCNLRRLRDTVAILQPAVRLFLRRLGAAGLRDARHKFQRRSDAIRHKLASLHAQLQSHSLTAAQRAGVLRLVTMQRYQLRVMQVCCARTAKPPPLLLLHNTRPHSPPPTCPRRNSASELPMGFVSIRSGAQSESAPAASCPAPFYVLGRRCERRHSSGSAPHPSMARWHAQEVGARSRSARLLFHPHAS